MVKMRAAIYGLMGVSVLLSACIERAPVEVQPKGGTDRRLELAQEYLAATKRVEHVRLVYEEQLKLSMTICNNKSCKADLDKITEDAALQVSRLYATKIAQIYARRLSENELRSAIRFAKSSDGEAFTRATDSATDDLAQLGHSMMVDARQSINRNFCASHPSICVPSVTSTSQTATSPRQ